MKLFKDLSLVYRLLAAVSETLTAYMVYLLMNYLWFGSQNGLSLLNLIMVTNTSVCCIYLVNLFKLKENVKYYSIAAAGLIINFVVIANSAVYLNAASLAISTAILLFLWLRGIAIAEAEAEGIYSLTRFYNGMLILLVAYLFTRFLPELHKFIPLVGQITIFFAVSSMLLLVKCKAARYMLLENKKRNNLIDMFAVAGLMLLMLILSSQKVMKAVLLTITAAVYWLSGLVYRLMIGFVYIIGSLLTKIVMSIRGRISENWKPDVGTEQGPDKYVEYVQNSRVEIRLRCLAYIVVVVCIILMFMGIRVLMRRYMKKRQADEYQEDREFILGTENVKMSMRKGMREIGKALAGAMAHLGSFNQSNRERIRHEYKKLLKLLYEKCIVVEGDTAEKIGISLRVKYPEAAPETDSITKIYERVRYGAAEPDSDEVKLFKTQVESVRVRISK